jgi:hypothetical protein
VATLVLAALCALGVITALLRHSKMFLYHTFIKRRVYNEKTL